MLTRAKMSSTVTASPLPGLPSRQVGGGAEFFFRVLKVFCGVYGSAVWLSTVRTASARLPATPPASVCCGVYPKPSEELL
jgi:hypothetical protein